MSNTSKRDFAKVNQVALKLVERLRPFCERIEIGGSLRRRAALVGDIEIVAIPVPVLDLFGAETGQTEVDLSLAKMPIEMLANGQRQKKFMLTSTTGDRYQVDLFLQPDPATWAMNLIIRTGSADFSHWLVTKRSLGGAMWDDCYSSGARLYWAGNPGTPLALPEEEDVFRFLRLPFVPPHARTEGAWRTLPAEKRPEPTL